MAKRRAKKRDEYLPNGSVIYWSRRFRDRRGHHRVPVRCGTCGEVHEINANMASGRDFTGLCRACADLGKMLQIPRSTLEQLCHEERLTQHEIAVPVWPRTRVLVPEEVLQQWTPELAYVVGLVAADGCLIRGSNVVSFLSTDRELVETYQRCLRVSTHVCTQPRPGYSPSYRIAFSDPAYRRFLEEVGLTPAKSWERTLGPLRIPDEFFCDFLRGVIDGDGSIGVYARQPSVRLFSVCRPFLAWIRDTVARLTVVEGTVCEERRKRPRKMLLCLRFTGRKAHRLQSNRKPVSNNLGAVDGI